MLKRGTRWLCGREVQKSLKESAKQLIIDKINTLKLSTYFDVQADKIITPGDGVITFQGLRDHTADTIKSFEGYHIFWGEEANKLSHRSLQIIRPTFRAEGSELWFSWNPQRKSDPIDEFLRGPTSHALDKVVVEANWRDNPWFPKVLEEERKFDETHNSATYDHVWEGAYATVVKGAYYAPGLAQAKREQTGLFADAATA